MEVIVCGYEKAKQVPLEHNLNFDWQENLEFSIFYVQKKRTKNIREIDWAGTPTLIYGQ